MTQRRKKKLLTQKHKTRGIIKIWYRKLSGGQSEHAFAIIALTRRCSDPLIRVFYHYWLENAHFASNVFRIYHVQSEISIEHQNLEINVSLVDEKRHSMRISLPVPVDKTLHEWANSRGARVSLSDIGTVRSSLRHVLAGELVHTQPQVTFASIQWDHTGLCDVRG